MISYLGSLVQFSPAAGRAGHCRQMSLCMGSTHRVLARQPAVLAASPLVLRAFSLRRAARAARSLRTFFPVVACLFPPRRAARAARGLCALSPGRGAPFPSAVSGQGSQRFGALSPGAPHLFPPRPQRAPLVGSQEVFRQEPGPVCRVGGGGFSGAEFAPFPSPCLLPPVGMGRIFSGVSQSLCFANRQRRCVPAGQFFSRSPTVLKNLPPTALRALWLVPTPRNAAGVWGVLFFWELLLGT